MAYRNGLVVRLAGVVVLISACQAGSPTDPGPDPAVSAGQIGTGGNSSTASTGSLVRVRCEVRSNRSRISVDGRNLRPANGVFSARATSGAGSATAPAKQAIGGEVEFDFDSDPGDIAAGATAIAATFITTDVTGEILDADGGVIATGTVRCTVK